MYLTKLVRRISQFEGITPSNRLGLAQACATYQLPHLEACFLNGQIELDTWPVTTDRTSDAIRPTKLGHKNWMFI